jgi:hypothetical protein
MAQEARETEYERAQQAIWAGMLLEQEQEEKRKRQEAAKKKAEPEGEVLYEAPDYRELVQERLAQEAQVAAAAELDGAQAQARKGGGGPGAVLGLGAKEQLEGAARFKRLMGATFIRVCWAMMALSFYHTVYLMDIAFIVGAFSPFVRKYIPEVGGEWMPSAPIPKLSRLGIKIGEIIALASITLYVMWLDAWLLLILSLVAAVYAKIIAPVLDSWIGRTVVDLASAIIDFITDLF